MVKRREPYQPSQAHLLVNSGTGGDGDKTITSAAADDRTSSLAAATTANGKEEEQKTKDAVAVPSSLSSTPSPATTTITASPAAAVDETDSLARYLCYGCLLVLSEPASASAQRANKTKFQNGPAAAAAAFDVFLPGYVSEAVQRRRDREKEVRDGRREEGVVGRREVRGEEGMRKELERYLLD